jgi:hypothetical protein
VTLWDGVFTNITVPSGAGLNEVLALLENYVTTTSQCNDVNYTLTAFSACLNLPAGTYSFTQIIDAIVAVTCANASSIAELQEQINEITTEITVNTTQVTLNGIIMPSCFTGFAGTTSTDLFQLILNNLCNLLNQQGPVVTPGEGDAPVTYEENDPGGNAQGDDDTNIAQYFNNARIEHIAETFKSILDNNSFLYEHAMPIIDTSSFTVPVQPMRAVVENFLVIRKEAENFSVNATKDTYFYLSAGGYILRREVAIAAPAPTRPDGSHPLYMVQSDGSGVQTITALYEDSPFTSPPPLGVDAVDTINIVDGAVTSVKMADVVVGKTDGDSELFELTFNDKGQVTAFDYNIALTAIADGHILKYNSGLLRFENVPSLTTPSTNVIPKGNGAGDDFVDSGLSENLTQVTSEKRIEINSGATENVAQSGLNIVEGTFMMPRYLAANADLLSLINGTMIYVIDTNATFTSLGVWAVENGVWIKL